MGPQVNVTLQQAELVHLPIQLQSAGDSAVLLRHVPETLRRLRQLGVRRRATSSCSPCTGTAVRRDFSSCPIGSGSSRTTPGSSRRTSSRGSRSRWPAPPQSSGCRAFRCRPSNSWWCRSRSCGTTPWNSWPARSAGWTPEDLAAFVRRASAFTMNLRFLATPEEHNTFNVKIEAYRAVSKDRRDGDRGGLRRGRHAPDPRPGRGQHPEDLRFCRPEGHGVPQSARQQTRGVICGAHNERRTWKPALSGRPGNRDRHR